jgi:hypothetical protein
MFSKIALAVVLAVAAAKNVDLSNYTFEQYLSDYNLKFHPSELESRRSAFMTELARVRAHNAKNLSWKEGVNQYSVMTAAEKKAFMGRHGGVAQAQEKMLKGSKSLPEDFVMKPVEHLPKHVDWREKRK